MPGEVSCASATTGRGKPRHRQTDIVGKGNPTDAKDLLAILGRDAKTVVHGLPQSSVGVTGRSHVSMSTHFAAVSPTRGEQISRRPILDGERRDGHLRFRCARIVTDRPSPREVSLAWPRVCDLLDGLQAVRRFGIIGRADSLQVLLI